MVGWEADLMTNGRQWNIFGFGSDTTTSVHQLGRAKCVMSVIHNRAVDQWLSSCPDLCTPCEMLHIIHDIDN